MGIKSIKDDIFLRITGIDNDDLKDDLYYLLDVIDYDISLKNKFYTFINTLINANKTVEEIEYIFKKLVVNETEFSDPYILNVIISKKISEASRQATKPLYPKADLKTGIWEEV